MNSHVFGVNLAAISVGNTNPRPGERAVAGFVASHPGPLRTDPYTAARAHWFVQWAHQDPARVLGGPPQLGDKFLFNPANATRPNRLLPAADVPLYAPDPKWPVISRTQDPPPLLGQVLGALGVGRFLPATIREKLVEPKPPILVYDVTTPPAARR